ncbi:hypothetical protein FZ103_07395 [Streptomonospora sp. PA3]|uniref:hypothetical protein n=1 Tax=Streptomonospora sp. PA3 TaxID=2607326 RepID=UPI0012DF8D85|nr:hypothetical protein [Streptomonospora sp. PA3]MUL41012.1 hypothetical protein [Streptomonospora sp. PA3]
MEQLVVYQHVQNCVNDLHRECHVPFTIPRKAFPGDRARRPIGDRIRTSAAGLRPRFRAGARLAFPSHRNPVRIRSNFRHTLRFRS